MIESFIINMFGDHVILATILMSIIPLIELKGAIPFGASQILWGVKALSVWWAYIWAIVGGFIITVILTFSFKTIYESLKDKKFFKTLIKFFTASMNKKVDKINYYNQMENLTLKDCEQNDIDKKNTKPKNLKKYIATIILVALPVPGTGVYTGSALAILLGLNHWQTIIIVTIGNIIAGIIVSTLCVIFPAFTHIILYIIIAIIVSYLMFRIVVYYVNKKSKTETQDIDKN